MRDINTGRLLDEGDLDQGNHIRAIVDYTAIHSNFLLIKVATLTPSGDLFDPRLYGVPVPGLNHVKELPRWREHGTQIRYFPTWCFNAD